MDTISKGRGKTRAGNRGYSLIELLVVVGIVALIAGIAYPSYSQFVAKSKRATATSALLQVADRQQQFFMDNKQYANKLSSLGYESDALVINDEGSPVSGSSDRRTYAISLQNVTATQFTVVATPQLAQADKDSKCGALTLTNAGVKGNTGSSDDCW